MTVRRRKRKNKLRGQRTHGKGDTKNHRGGGSKGGRGRAGSHKHKFNKYSDEFGTEKKQVIGGEKAPAINLDKIEQMLPKWVETGKAEKQGNSFSVDGNKAGFGKIVSSGELVSKVVFENVKASKKALEKLAKSGSSIKGLEKQEAGEKKEEGKETTERREKEAEKEDKEKGMKEKDQKAKGDMKEKKETEAKENGPY